MRIAIVSPGPFTVPPVRGSSVEHDIDEVSKELALEHSVLIYSRKSREYSESQQKGNIHYIRFAYRSPKEYIRRIVHDLKNRQVDAVLIENRPVYVPIVRKHLPDTTIVLNMHSHVYASPANISRENMQRVVQQMDAMITNSHFLRQYFINRHQIDGAKVHAVHLGVHLEPYVRAAFSPEIPKLRKKHGLKESHRVLLFAGRIIREKGVHLLIKAFRKVAREDPQARLVIVGGTGYGSNRNSKYVRYLHKLAQPVKTKVKFIDFVSPRKMPLYYQIADIVATPSVWNEAFCRVNLEAMASGKPVLSSTKGGISEVIVHTKSGALIPPSQWERELSKWWKLLWNSENQREEMGRSALVRAGKFSWQATAWGYVQVIQSCQGLKSINL